MYNIYACIYAGYILFKVGIVERRLLGTNEGEVIQEGEQMLRDKLLPPLLLSKDLVDSLFVELHLFLSEGPEILERISLTDELQKELNPQRSNQASSALVRLQEREALVDIPVNPISCTKCKNKSVT